MVVTERLNLPHERTSDYAEFVYTPVRSKNEIFDEIKVVVSFTFGKRDTNEFNGFTYPIKDHDENKLEAESFLDASKKVWTRYKMTEDKYKNFVKQKLTEKWIELQGENLTGKSLEFD